MHVRSAQSSRCGLLAALYIKRWPIDVTRSIRASRDGRAGVGKSIAGVSAPQGLHMMSRCAMLRRRQLEQAGSQACPLWTLFPFAPCHSPHNASPFSARGHGLAVDRRPIAGNAACASSLCRRLSRSVRRHPRSRCSQTTWMAGFTEAGTAPRGRALATGVRPGIALNCRLSSLAHHTLTQRLTSKAKPTRRNNRPVSRSALLFSSRVASELQVLADQLSKSHSHKRQ